MNVHVVYLILSAVVRFPVASGIDAMMSIFISMCYQSKMMKSKAYA